MAARAPPLARRREQASGSENGFEAGNEGEEPQTDGGDVQDSCPKGGPQNMRGPRIPGSVRNAYRMVPRFLMGFLHSCIGVRSALAIPGDKVISS